MSGYLWNPGPEVLNAIADLCHRYKVQELSVFGSALGPSFGPASDVDLLVTFQPNARISLIELSRLQRELSQAIGWPVDLVTKPGLKPMIRDGILAQAQVLYAA